MSHVEHLFIGVGWIGLLFVEDWLKCAQIDVLRRPLVQVIEVTLKTAPDSRSLESTSLYWVLTLRGLSSDDGTQRSKVVICNSTMSRMRGTSKDPQVTTA